MALASDHIGLITKETIVRVPNVQKNLVIPFELFEPDSDISAGHDSIKYSQNGLTPKCSLALIKCEYSNLLLKSYGKLTSHLPQSSEKHLTARWASHSIAGT